MSGHHVTLTDFAGDSTLAVFAAAARYCREHPGTTLRIPPGRYVLRDEAAVRLMEDALAGRLGENPQERIFTHDFPYARGFALRGCENVTVEGRGAWLVSDGWMEPVTVEDSRHVTLRGLTLDCLRKPYSVGRVIREDEGGYDVLFDARYPVSAATPAPRIHAYLWERGRFSGEGWECTQRQAVAPQVIRFMGEKPFPLLGHTLIVWHGFHFRPGIFLNESNNVLVEDVTIHSQPGMGVIGHRCENLRFRGLRIVPEAGELLSTNTDATHFTSCKGALHFENCQFEGHGDDALNVHNYYYTLRNARGNRCDATVEEADAHAQVLDYPDVGDTLELTRADSLAPVRTYRVLAVDADPKGWKAGLTLDGDLPADTAGMYLVNLTRLPRLTFRGCHVKNHLARAVLIKTRHALVENCTFEDSMGTAIHIAAEGGWREGVPARDVTIRHNRMIRCGHGQQGRIMGTCGVCVNIDADVTDTPGLHRGIRIKDNIILGEGAAQGVYLSCARDVTVRNNEFAGCRETVTVCHCSRVTVEGNHIRT